MAKQSNQKLKALYLLKILTEKTDPEHPLTIAQLIELLAQYDITAERKSLYDDIEALRGYGADIETVRGKSVGYYMSSRTFELPELKLLVDAVQSSKFITTKKSMELIKKIETLCSTYEASQLNRQVFVQNRIKTMNECIYYNVDRLQDAISQNVQIAFRYKMWDIHGEQVFKHNGAEYRVSPWALTWDDENYYAVVYDETANTIKHFRVDKMQNIRLLSEKRKGQNVFDSFDTAIYSKKIFGMYGGEEKNVTLLCDKSLVGVIIDRFGKDTMLMQDGDRFTVTVRIYESPLFLSWVIGFGDKMQVLRPESTRNAVIAQAQAVLNVYKTEDTDA